MAKTLLEEVTPQYTVKRGDNLWDISRKHNLNLDELRRMNPQLKGDLIHAGDKVNLDYAKVRKQIDLKKEWAREDVLNATGDNRQIINAAAHNGNYAIIDKKARTIEVYDKTGKQLDVIQGISTGKAGTDYNTVTYQGDKGLENYGGNNSTPAGITRITSVGEYHGAPSFTRGRVGSDGNVGKVRAWKKDKDGRWYQSDELVDDNISSSVHIGDTSESNISNGCIRVTKAGAQRLASYLGTGDDMYTLPEQGGSGYSIKGGQLNYTARNPNGITEKGHMSESGHDMITWDDYNVTQNNTYSPLTVQAKQNKAPTGFISGISDTLINRTNTRNKNAKAFAASLSANKQSLQKRLGIDSDTYNRLSSLAMGLAEQESGFGSSYRYHAKEKGGNLVQDAMQGLRGIWNTVKKNPLSIMSPVTLAYNGVKSAINEGNSKGITQIKYSDDIKNKELAKIYSDLGVTEDKLDDPKYAALATMARLAFTYNNEVKGRTFKAKGKKTINDMTALLYKYNGRHRRLKSGEAEPEKNTYIQNVQRYANQHDYYETRTERK